MLIVSLHNDCRNRRGKRRIEFSDDLAKNISISILYSIVSFSKSAENSYSFYFFETFV